MIMDQAPAFLRQGLLILVFDRDGRGILLCAQAVLVHLRQN
jgi:hypothetical protein